MTTTRRRGATLEAAIHGAVMNELAAHGYSGVTFEGVAAAAATSKAVLYRRWPTRPELILSAVISTNRALIPLPDTGSLKGDLRALMLTGRSAFGDMRQAILGLLSELDGVASDALRTLVFTRSAELVRPIIAQAVMRGELSEEPVAPRALTLAVDLLRHETLLRGSLDDEVIDELLDQCVLPLLMASAAPETASRQR